MNVVSFSGRWAITALQTASYASKRKFDRREAKEALRRSRFSGEEVRMGGASALAPGHSLIPLGNKWIIL